MAIVTLTALSKKITEDGIHRLEAIGFKWTLRAAINRTNILFEERIEELKMFKEKHGHCDAGSHKASKEYKSLGVWSNKLRYAYKRKGSNKLTEDTIHCLEEIGFKRTIAATTTLLSFDQRIKELKRFKEKHGNCDVSMSSKGYKYLGKWSVNTRRAYKGTRKWKKLTEDRTRNLDEIGFKWTTTATKSFQNDSKCDPAGGARGSVYLPSGDNISASIQYQNDESVQKTVTTTSVSLVQCETTKRQTNHDQLNQRLATITPGCPLFDPSRYTVEELEDAVEESKRVCREMQMHEAAKVDEIANRLFESDDDESENISEEDSGSADGPNDDEEHIAA